MERQQNNWIWTVVFMEVAVKSYKKQKGRYTYFSFYFRILTQQNKEKISDRSETG